MTDTLQDRVLDLVSESTGVKREKLQLATTLSGDLGMEGDDAVEFFDSFRTKFALDLQDLERDWRFYFSPEGLPITTALLVAIPAVVIAILLERFLPRLHGMLAIGIGALLSLAVLVQWSRWRYKDRPQISLEDLVQSAASGKWTKAVPDKCIRRINNPRFYDRFIV